MELRQQQEQLEAVTLSPHARRSAQTRGRARPETECGIRTCFQRDTDRIVYSKAFRRLKHKTQVFLQPLESTFINVTYILIITVDIKAIVKHDIMSITFI